MQGILLLYLYYSAAKGGLGINLGALPDLFSPGSCSPLSATSPSFSPTGRSPASSASVSMPSSRCSCRLAAWYATVSEGVYFGVLGGIAIVLGMILALIARPVARLMGGVR